MSMDKIPAKHLAKWDVPTYFIGVVLDREILGIWEKTNALVCKLGLGNKTEMSPPDNLHMTIAYFGNKLSPNEAQNMAKEVMEKFWKKNAVLHLDSSGFFFKGKERKLRVAYFSPAKVHASMESLSDEIREAYCHMIDHEPPYNMHVTFMRFRDQFPTSPWLGELLSWMRSIAKGFSGKNFFWGIRLFESIQGKNGKRIMRPVEID